MHRDERIRDLAYRIWESRGRPSDASGDEDWLEAERQLANEPPLLTEEAAPSTFLTDETLKASFPASDPAASRLPDEPPANAAAKWEAADSAASESPKRPLRRRTSSSNDPKSAE